jgi:hypothetical protein
LEEELPRREDDHSHPSSAEVKNAWSYTSIPQYTFMACCSVEKSTGTTLPSRLLYPPYLETVSSIHNLRTRHAVVTETPHLMYTLHKEKLFILYSVKYITMFQIKLVEINMVYLL